MTKTANDISTNLLKLWSVHTFSCHTHSHFVRIKTVFFETKRTCNFDYDSELLFVFRIFKSVSTSRILHSASFSNIIHLFKCSMSEYPVFQFDNSQTGFAIVRIARNKLTAEFISVAPILAHRAINHNLKMCTKIQCHWHDFNSVSVAHTKCIRIRIRIRVKMLSVCLCYRFVGYTCM